MADWGYIIAGFGLSGGAIALYAMGLERRIAALRSRRRPRGRR